MENKVKIAELNQTNKKHSRQILKSTSAYPDTTHTRIRTQNRLYFSSVNTILLLKEFNVIQVFVVVFNI